MKLRNLLLTGIITALLLPVASFAEEVEHDERDWKEFRLEQVAKYTPDQLVEWTRLFDSKEVLKSEREVLKTELDILIETVWKPLIESEKKEVKEAIQAYADDLKVKVEAGDLTKEEATSLLEAFKAEIRVDFEEIKAKREADKAERETDKVYCDGLREDRKTINESIKLAVENGELDLIAGYLNEILVINQTLELHVIEINELIQDKINEINDL
ncbi:MAG: hypothetical protein JEZ08_19940 [Clostridiales bacterium]|nr:hypothetical protein [Clostridiales bacterium]